MLPPTLKARPETARQWVGDSGDKLHWLALLLVRLTVGVVFLRSGWGKLHSLDNVTQFFTSLGLPAPRFQATLVASTEFVGGLLLLLGLFTRFAAVPLMITMVVAILTAKADDLKDWGAIFAFDEYAYLVFFAVAGAFGAGRLSLDHALAKLLKLGDTKQTFTGLLATAQKGLVVAAGVGLLVLTLWGVSFDHNPCLLIGKGEFPDIVAASHRTGRDANEAWGTCRQILDWKKEGKDPKEELKKQEE